MLLASTGPLEWLEQLELILSLEADVGCWPGPISIPHCPWLGPTSGTDSTRSDSGNESVTGSCLCTSLYPGGLAMEFPWKKKEQDEL